MRIKPILFILMLTLNLNGCAVIDAYDAARKTVLDPTEFNVKVEEHEGHYVRTDKDKGSLYVVWSATFARIKQSLSGIYVYVNGERIGAVVQNSYTVIDLTPGTYEIAVGDKDGYEEAEMIHITEDQNVYYYTGIKVSTFLPLPDSLYLLEDDDIDHAKKVQRACVYVTLKAM